jgi:hypothetical protein
LTKKKEKEEEHYNHDILWQLQHQQYYIIFRNFQIKKKSYKEKKSEKKIKNILKYSP